MPRILNTVGSKLIAAFVAMMVIIGLQGAYGYSVLTKAGGIVIDTFDHQLMAVNYARAANFDLSQIERKMAEQPIAAVGHPKAPDSQLKSLLSDFDDDLAVAEERSTGSDEHAQIRSIRSLMAQWLHARESGDAAGAAALARRMDNKFDLLIEYNTDHSFVARREAVDAIAFFRYILVAGLAASLTVSLLIVVLLALRIGRPLSHAAATARSIANGELETPIPSGGNDETGALLRSMTVMQQSIRAMVTKEKSRASSAETRLSDALETSDEGVILVGPDGRIAIANSRVQSYFPAFASSLVPGAEYGRVTAALSKSLDTTFGKGANEEHQLPDGRWLRFTTSPTTDGGRIVFVSDFTQIKEREEHYRVAKLQAEAASAAKSRFLANMSHELRTPLNAIIGFSQIINTQLLGPIANTRYVEYATDILRAGLHLLDVINGVLDLSKSEAGKLLLRAEDVDLRYILKDCTKMISGQCEKEGIKFSSAGFDREIPLQGEKAKLRQIFLNLLSNAIKFTDAGGSVALKAEVDDENVSITVSDTGIGMSHDDMQIAMVPFGQVDSRLQRKYEGTGLGLPLAASLIELHGGKLHIDSHPGKGTTVEVTFPLRPIQTATEKLKPKRLARM